MQKAKWLSEEALQIAEKKRESENEDAVMSNKKKCKRQNGCLRSPYKQLGKEEK